MIGAGTMGGGISMNFLSAGIPVTIVEMGQEALDRGTGLMRKNYEASAAKGKLTVEQVSKAMGLLTPTLDFAALADCDLIIEAVYENMDVKKEVFGRLDKIAKPGAILASNTSYLNIDEIAASISRPAGRRRHALLLAGQRHEAAGGRARRKDRAGRAPDRDALARRSGKSPVVAGVCHGFIGNRMLMPRQIEATKLLLEGATPEQIDKVHVEFGMPMGPFQMADLAGVDIGWHRDPNRIENIRDALCAIDRWGQKKGAGFYDYDEKRRPTPSPVVQQIIEDFAKKQGVERREISDEEIVERTLYTMVNEGAKILEEGIAQRASDIDVVWVYGYGWPVYRGGPMFWADTLGSTKIVEGLKRQEERMEPRFSFSKLLLEKRRTARSSPASARGASSGSRLSIASATAATTAWCKNVAALPSRSHSKPAPRLASRSQCPSRTRMRRSWSREDPPGRCLRSSARTRPGQRHVRAPQKRRRREADIAGRPGKDEIADDQDCHSRHQDRARRMRSLSRRRDRQGRCKRD